MLDLGFFRAIQSLQHQKFPKTVDALVTNVIEAYACYDPKIINYTWLQHMYCMVEILKVKGGNNYKSPHKGKKRLDRLGLLPSTVIIPLQLVEDTVDYLNEGIVCLRANNNEDVPSSRETDGASTSGSGGIRDNNEAGPSSRATDDASTSGSGGM